ncbi:MAG: hypothetical protein FWC69_03575 [Defluviitaleaceae bacterium]|nr:hypothetical protein [Defluviitaleaceae bacterium]
MFSKTIFKQTFKSNIRLWLIITVILVALSTLIIGIFNPDMMERVLGFMERAIDDPEFLARMQQEISLINVLGMNFYAGMGLILVLIYIIITANSLVVSKVDRGSMAYILSTPIKRSTVIVTQAIYMIIALVVMFSILAASGLVTAEVSHGGVFFERFTDDVTAVAEEAGMEEAYVAADLNMILENPQLLAIGAEARGIEVEVYAIYLTMLIAQGDDMPQPERTPEQTAMEEQMETAFVDGLEAAAEHMEIEMIELFGDLRALLADHEALGVAVAASGLPVEHFVQGIYMQLAMEEIFLDSRFQFDIGDYIWLNIGMFLLMFATAAISFFFSCLFNLSKHAIALGAGIPIAFYIFQTMAMVGEDLEFFRYFTINTLYNPIDIAAGNGFAIQFAILGVIGVILYGLSVVVFKKKDLPL